LKAIALPVSEFQSNWGAVLGCVVAANVPDFAGGSGYLFRKGEVLRVAAHSEIALKLKTLAYSAPADYALHLLQMSEGEINEDEAGLRLACLVSGSGLRLSGPIESRVNLLAKTRGLLRIDVARLDRINEVPGVAVFTLYDGMAVEAGTEVAGAKVTPLIYPVNLLDQVAQLTQSDSPVIDVIPFQPLRVGVLVREQLKPQPRARFVQTVEQKLGWFGAELLDIIGVESSVESLRNGLLAFQAQGADLILHMGGHSNDPLDPVFAAMSQLDIKMERHGAPAHPGTLFWLAYWGEVALFGLASCGMFSKTTLGDLFLARLLTGERLTAQAVAKMGHGGLFTREMAFRFPPYSLPDRDSA
jgi:hypothetical protein